MYCRNPNCGYPDHGGSVGTPCPGCSHPIGFEPTDEMVEQASTKPPAIKAARKRSARMAVAAKDWQFYQVVDGTTPRRVTQVCRASSLADAEGLARQWYRQKGWRYNEPLMEFTEVGKTPPPDTPDYLVWRGSGRTKHVACVGNIEPAPAKG